MSSWLYDEGEPWLGLKDGDIYENMKQAADSGLFEKNRTGRDPAESA
jgi:hypothetical protein